jgi:hypothetical protein
MNPAENTNQDKRNASDRDLDLERGPVAASKKQREEFFSSSTTQSQASFRDCIFDEGVDSGAPSAVPLADDFFANSAVIYGSFMEGNSSFAKLKSRLLSTADRHTRVGGRLGIFGICHAVGNCLLPSARVANSGKNANL